MHDIDRALFEAEAENYGETYETFGEDREQEQVAGLLEVTTEEELDRFLGDLLNTAVSAARNFAGSDAGRAVGGMLKSAAKQALPQLGQLAGDALRPGGQAGAFGRKAGEWLGNRLETGLQTEGLSAEDREYQTAQAFVRFANETAQGGGGRRRAAARRQGPSPSRPPSPPRSGTCPASCGCPTGCRAARIRRRGPLGPARPPHRRHRRLTHPPPATNVTSHRQRGQQR